VGAAGRHAGAADATGRSGARDCRRVGLTVAALPRAIVLTDAWLESVRGPDGLGGPVTHWWQNCLVFVGAGIDWRYEGVVLGYLALFKRTGQRVWLHKARRAADDVVKAQLSSGNFRNSCFELNPYSGGTPHEAACDLALLRLADVLRDEGDAAWSRYMAVAERNIEAYYLGRLWDPRRRMFRDDPASVSFVPNKSATLTEALFALASLTGREAPLETHARPTLEAILEHQVRGGSLDGAIFQNTFGGRRVAKFFPYYIARCVPGLLLGYARWRDERYLDAARRAVGFVLRWRYDDGSFPQVVYPGDRVNRYPQWVAATGDILRALRLMQPYSGSDDGGPTRAWLLAGQLPNGGFRTAHGFAAQPSQRPPAGLPELRDVLPVCGWTDKAFRYLAESLPESGASDRPPGDSATANEEPDQIVAPAFESECVFRGQYLQLRDDAASIEVRRGARLTYLWRKGTSWAQIADPLLVLK
jgi:hypothetical protein